MTGIVRAEEAGMLEEIAEELGSDMAIEKAAVQNRIVSGNVYDAATSSSELLIRISNELVSVLDAPYSTNLYLPCQSQNKGCQSKLAVNKRGRVKIDTSHFCGSMPNVIKVMPQKGKINIRFPESFSYTKSGAVITGGLGSFVSGMLLFTPYTPISMLFTLILPVAAGCLFIPNSPLTRDAYTHESFFKDTSRFAFRHSRQEADNFIDEYLSLPSRIYSAAEYWIEKNKQRMGALEARRAEFKQLEEKLR